MPIDPETLSKKAQRLACQWRNSGTATNKRDSDLLTEASREVARRNDSLKKAYREFEEARGRSGRQDAAAASPAQTLSSAGAQSRLRSQSAGSQGSFTAGPSPTPDNTGYEGGFSTLGAKSPKGKKKKAKAHTTVFPRVELAI